MESNPNMSLTRRTLSFVLTALFAAALAVGDGLALADSTSVTGVADASSKGENTDGVEGIAICRLTAADVVRHPLVQRLVQAYARRDAQNQGRR